MSKLQPAVKKNLIYVAIVNAVLSLILQAVFLVLSLWDVTVLYGNLLGYFCSLINFFLLCLTVQNAVDVERDDARKIVARSQRLRLLMMLAAAIIGYLVPFFNLYAVVISFLFNGIAVVLRTFVFKDNES